MGNAGSGAREGGRRGDSPAEPRSPSPQPHGEAFIFPPPQNAPATPKGPGQKRASAPLELDEHEELEAEGGVAGGVSADGSPVAGRRARPGGRPRANTVSEGTTVIESRRVLPTVFKWEGGGKQVLIQLHLLLNDVRWIIHMQLTIFRFQINEKILVFIHENLSFRHAVYFSVSVASLLLDRRF